MIFIYIIYLLTCTALIFALTESYSHALSYYSTVGSELIRIPADSIVITKEKIKNGGRGPPINRETSKPSRGGSTQTSGRTTPISSKPHKMMSEAAIKVSASLLSHNDRWGPESCRVDCSQSWFILCFMIRHCSQENALSSLGQALIS